jgi:hypothetical protein
MLELRVAGNGARVANELGQLVALHVRGGVRSRG